MVGIAGRPDVQNATVAATQPDTTVSRRASEPDLRSTENASTPRRRSESSAVQTHASVFAEASERLEGSRLGAARPDDTPQQMADTANRTRDLASAFFKISNSYNALSLDEKAYVMTLGETDRIDTNAKSTKLALSAATAVREGPHAGYHRPEGNGPQFEAWCENIALLGNEITGAEEGEEMFLLPETIEALTRLDEYIPSGPTQDPRPNRDHFAHEA